MYTVSVVMEMFAQHEEAVENCVGVKAGFNATQ